MCEYNFCFLDEFVNLTMWVQQRVSNSALEQAKILV